MKWSQLLDATRSNELTGDSNRVSTQSPEDTRSQFQRDYDRTLFSSPVRRLQDKAQVFPLEPHDSVRTRLTHSLEVANIAQGLTRKALGMLPAKFLPTPEEIEQLTTIAATCGLVHDLGNPPFGHAGEEAMIEWFTRKFSEASSSLRVGLQLGPRDLSQDFERFDGNPQTLRLLTRLTMLGDYNGLSLTTGALSASLKYISPSDKKDEEDHARGKPGFFFSEEVLVRKIQKQTGTNDARNPITFLVEAADDIVYSSVDLEDGIKKGSLSWAELIEEFNDAGVGPATEDVFAEVEKNLDGRLSLSGIKLNVKERDEPLSQLLRTMLIWKHTQAASEAFVKNIDAIMAGTFTSELLKEGSTNRIWAASKAIARKRVFPSPSILRLELMGQEVIHDLMSFFWKGIEHAPYEKPKGLNYKTYMLLSNNYRKVFENAKKQDIEKGTNIPLNYRRLQLLADYICGMTDTFAVTLHKELFNG